MRRLAAPVVHALFALAPALAQQQAWTELNEIGATGVFVTNSPTAPRVVSPPLPGYPVKVSLFTNEGFATQVEPTPLALSYIQAATYDEARHRTVSYNAQFSGIGGSGTSTWCLFDGATWSLGASGPTPARIAPVLSYDPVRGTVLLFGGVQPTLGTGTPLADTWELDGYVWSQLTPTTSPSARTFSSAAIDRATGRVVLFGGVTAQIGGTALADTWTFDGTTWISIATATSPPARSGHTMASDPSGTGVILYGGKAMNGSQLGDAWRFDGIDWAPLPAPLGGQPLGAPALANDDSDLVLFGRIGVQPGVVHAVRWNGAAWDTEYASSSIDNAFYPGLALDTLRHEVVRFGGREQVSGSLKYLNTMWTFDGAWHQESPAHVPPARSYTPLAFDPLRGEVLLFGGLDGVTALNDTWVWDGTDWHERTTLTSPPASSQHAMTFDPSRGTVVLQTSGSTWEWNGTDWAPVPTATQPPSVTGSLAFDASNNVLVYYANKGSIALSELWQLQPSGWVLVDASAPSYGRLVYDSSSGRLAIFAAASFNGGSIGRHDFVGGAWTFTGQNIAGLEYTFDPARGGLLAMGLIVSLSTSTPAEHAVYGDGCGSAEKATLAFDRLPKLGADMRAVVRAPLPDSPMFLFFGLTPASAPFGACTAHIGSVILTFTGVADVSGWASLPTHVPLEPALAGFDVWAQVFVAYPAPLLGEFGLSNGVRLQLGQ